MTEDEFVTRLQGPAQALEYMRLYAQQATRTLDIFSHQLNPLVYEDEGLMDAISILARRSAQSQVRLLVRDTRALHGRDHALVRLARRLPSHMAIKAYTEGAADPNMGFFCIDRGHLLYFGDEPALVGFAREDARAESRNLLEEFDYLWRYGSKNDPNLKSLAI